MRGLGWRSVAVLVLVACKGEPEPTPVDTACDVVGFVDRDGDGYGNPAQTANGCDEAVVQDATDCDDLNFLANPGRVEVCNGFDDDCDGLVDADDPDADVPIAFPDADGDGFGTGDGERRCDVGPNDAAVGGDCDDANPQIHPDAPEICDEIDNDCDELVDDADPGLELGSTPVWFLDADQDGFAGTNIARTCVQPPFSQLTADDCDDADADVYPGAPERCNLRDDDCDGTIDGAPCGDFDGAWSGPYTVTLTLGTDTRTCAGTASIVVDRAADPVLQGSFTCALDLAEPGWDATQSGSLTGVVYRDGALEGEIDAFQGVPRTWSGSAGQDALTGGGSGLFVSGGAWSVTYGFDVSPAP